MLVALNLMRGDFVADSQSVIHQVYDRAGMPLTPEALGAVDKWSTAHPQHEHRDHQYSVRKYKGPVAFFDELKSKGIFTPHHPVKDMPGEARCYKFAHQYCTATSSKAQDASMEALKAIEAAEPQHSALAQECLEILSRGEVPCA